MASDLGVRLAARPWPGVRRGTLRASGPVTVNEGADDLIEGMESGSVRTRSGDRYKPSTVRSYREALDLYVRADLGAMRLGDVQRRHVQALADRLVAVVEGDGGLVAEDERVRV